MLRMLLIAIALTFAAPVSAQQVLAEYLAWLGPEDTVNSRGTRLTSFAAIVQQDRANFHRFGIRHQLDTVDPLFHDRSLRSQIPSLVNAGRRVESYILDEVLSGRGHYVLVRVLGVSGRITHIDVYEGAG